MQELLRRCAKIGLPGQGLSAYYLGAATIRMEGKRHRGISDPADADRGIVMRSRIAVLALTLPWLLASCGGSHQSAQPVAQTEPGVLDQRMKEMQSELEQMRLQQEQMKQQQEQQRQQQLQLLYQQRQAAAASGAAPPAGGVPESAPPPPSGSATDGYFPAFQWFDPTAPKEKLDKENLDQKL